MLTAVNEEGQIVQLAGQPLDRIEKRLYYCPACAEPVIPKCGSEKIWHFAHKANGICPQGGETAYHLLGKKRLYDWLTSQGVDAKIEYYLSELQQRPDIYFVRNQKAYVLEFQCATVPIDTILARTKVYKQHDIHVLWILGHKRVHAQKPPFHRLQQFDWSFAPPEDHPNNLLTFCPHSNMFTEFHSICPVTKTKIIAQTTTYAAQQFSVYRALHATKKRSPLQLTPYWLTAKKSWRSAAYWQSAYKQGLPRKYYEATGTSISLVPGFIGIPSKGSEAFAHSVWDWQCIVFVTFLYPYMLSRKPIKSEAVKQWLTQAIEQKLLVVRPCIYCERDPFEAIQSYIEQLVHLEVCQKKANAYVFLNALTMPRMIDEALREDEKMLSVLQKSKKAHQGRSFQWI
ncbi:competence protein CoiA [Aureibacillus halotolerans]|uniref:Competence CoiA-like predicted nuclease n=1 Tax=Aureibacillus halotolerans TaxID=1508390 RepID=A0A4R6U8K4_9BACI|nr:competence protein CoiA family protein [Aureibacillus halotolerans]TDQ42136.1 competence CoiA-like predicted nuclease [Aureibacillus halotolerans]